MNLFIINRKNANKNIFGAFKTAAKKNHIKIIEVNIDNYLRFKLSKRDFVYRISSDANSRYIEKEYSFYKPITLRAEKGFNILESIYDNVVNATMLHQFYHLPIPKTEFINSSDKLLLKNTTKKLGGYPIVIKLRGSQKGMGVIKINNYKEYQKQTKNLIEQNLVYITREFVDSPGLSYRAIVLGDVVLVCYKNQSVHEDEFRSNTDQKQRVREIIKLDKAEEKIMVKAVNVLDIEFGAVDFAYDKSDADKLKIFEVNYPCNFVPAQKLSGIDIAEKILIHLLNK